MKTKTFFISSLIVIALVTIVTSLISVYYIQRPLLLAYGDNRTGLINVTNISSNINVIVVDNNTRLGITDELDFGTASDGSLRIWVSDRAYDEVDDIPDSSVRNAVKKAVDEFNL